ncbi:MAG TPA: glycosyltransferase family 39 protein [Terriglobales bacterium]|nr:glycosyltransferase family 39 protein [Terriglobales bacterium]
MSIKRDPNTMTASTPLPDKFELPRSTAVLVGLIALTKLVLHLATDGRYGYFRDELYYIACSRHLDWGYVDQPPLIAVVTWLELHIGGTSLHVLRFLPAIAGTALVVLAAFLAREMGARKFGIWFASLATACIGVSFVMDYLLTMNAFEPLFWTGCAYILVRIINTGNQKLWVWFGAIAGIGLQTKYSMGIFGCGIVVGLLLTPERKALAQRWIWIGGVVAALIFLPNLIWNIQHHWPFVELMRNIRESGRDVELSPLRYVAEQLFVVTPVPLLVAVTGLLHLFFSRDGGRYRALAWAFVVSLAVIIAMKGKNYYIVPGYPMLMTAGAVAMERVGERRHWVWLKPAIVILMLAVLVVVLPLGIPVLSAEGFLHYETKLPFALPVSEKSHRGAAMPQYYSDQFGWEEMTAAVARVYGALTPEERKEACIGAGNYGEAGAVDFFGPKYGLPNAISGHQSYFLWGPRNCTGKILILLGERPDEWQERCDRLDVAAELYHPYAIRFENGPVLVCHGFKSNVQEIWPRVKNWD